MRRVVRFDVAHFIAFGMRQDMDVNAVFRICSTIDYKAYWICRK
jgi:hypothetical protein